MDGTLLQALAEQALQTSKLWDEPHPSLVEVVVSTQAAVNRQIESQYGYDYGDQDTAPAYVVELRGHFRCGRSNNYCDASIPAVGGTTSTPPATAESVVPISYMILYVPISPSESGGGGLRVGRLDPDLLKVGHVVDLQPYIDGHG